MSEIFVAYQVKLNVRGPLGRRPPSFKHRGRRETAGEEKEERAETTVAEEGRQDDLNNNENNQKASKTIDTSKSSSEDKALSKVSWKKRVKQCVIL